LPEKKVFVYLHSVLRQHVLNLSQIF